MLTHNVPALLVSCELRNELFSTKIIFLAKRKREFWTKFAIARNGCYTFGCVKRKKFYLKLIFSTTFSATTFHFPFFDFPHSVFLKILHYSQKNSSFARNYILKRRDFQQQIFSGSFSSQKLTNRKNSITEKRYTFSDKFSTQNFSSFHFNFLFLRRNFLLNFSEFLNFDSRYFYRIFFRSNWRITFRRFSSVANFGTNYFPLR